MSPYIDEKIWTRICTHTFLVLAYFMWKFKNCVFMFGQNATRKTELEMQEKCLENTSPNFFPIKLYDI